jgi:GNAT superfamily N-acetyltransferase
MSGKREALRDSDGIAALHGCPQAEVSDRRRARDQAPFERGPVSPLSPQLRIALSRRSHSLPPPPESQDRILRCGKAAPELEVAHGSYVILPLNVIDLIVIGTNPDAMVRLILQRNMIRSPQRSWLMPHPLPRGGLIRKLWIGESERYRDHLLRLDAGSRRNRFAGAVSDQFVRDYADLSFGIDALIHGFLVDDTLRGAAELRQVGSPMTREAEVAFSIEKPWQSHGVGSMLLERTLLAARNRGLKFLHMACLADNKRMQQLARKYDAELSFDFSSVVGEVAAPRPTPLSLMREIIADGHGFATAIFDVQSRLLKPV